MQYKNKKNLYKIVFITILLGFIISLVGCNWLSFGLLNIFDPQAQIRIKNFDYVNDNKNIVTFEVFTINQVEFIITGFESEYYRGSTKLDALTSSVGANYYVAPSSGPGEEGAATKITDLCLYSLGVLDYVKTYSAFNEISCDIFMIGTDGAGHNLSIEVASGLSALGIDNEAPKAVISAEPMSGNPPLTVIFDGSGSTDNGIGIAQYEWDYGDGTTATGVMPEPHTYTESGAYIVMLTVTDYFGNMGIAVETINVEEAGAPTAVINVAPSTTGIAPFTVYFDASDSSVESGCSACSIVSYSWNFGDTGTGTGITTSHEYTTAGTYVVMLTVTDSNGNIGYDSVTITVSEVGVPTAVISTTPDPPIGIEPFTVYFDASQSSGPTSIVSYDWNFGDTGTGTGLTTSHEYTTAGTYVVILTVTDSNANSGYDSVTITVYEAGVPSTMTLQANPTTVTAGSGTSLITATVKDAGGDPVDDATVVTFIATSPGILSGITTTTGGIATATLTLSNASAETISSTVGATSGTAFDDITVYCPPPS